MYLTAMTISLASSIATVVGIACVALLAAWGLSHVRPRRRVAGTGPSAEDRRGQLIKQVERSTTNHAALARAWLALQLGPSDQEVERLVLALLALPRPPYPYIVALLDSALDKPRASDFFARLVPEHHRRLRHLGLMGLSRKLSVDPALRGVLLEEYRSEDGEARVLALRPLLATYAGDSTPPVFLLRQMAADPDWRVRAAAATAMARWGTMTVVTVLRGLLTDSAWRVRHSAARALTAVPHLGVPALESMNTHPDPYARDVAADALDLLLVAVTKRAQGSGGVSR